MQRASVNHYDDKMKLEMRMKRPVRPHSAATHSSMAVAVVGGLLIAVIVALVVFVLLRRRRIRRKRTLRRILQEREVRGRNVHRNTTSTHTHLSPVCT